MCRPPLLLLALLLLVFQPGRAQAEEASEYARVTERGLAEFGERNFEEARALFLKAHALSPSARTLRALGMVEFELKSYVDSVRYLEEALSSTERPLDGARRAEAQTLLETANAYVARYVLRVASETTLSLDGSGIEKPRELVLAIGTHELEFRAPDHITQRRMLKVKGGEREQLTVTLLPLASAKQRDGAAASSTRDDTRASRPLYKNPWLWSAVGIVVVGASAATAIALLRQQDGDTKVEAPDVGSGGAGPLMPPP
jgi:tetratricopeptide (TPR) repeat protein